jgi:large subunit ribosomal protein L35
MPKLKTKKSAAKRFKKTATGKLKHKRAYLRHILSTKSKEQKRRLRKAGLVADSDAKRIKKLLPYA